MGPQQIVEDLQVLRRAGAYEIGLVDFPREFTVPVALRFLASLHHRAMSDQLVASFLKALEHGVKWDFNDQYVRNLITYLAQTKEYVLGQTDATLMLAKNENRNSDAEFYKFGEPTLLEVRKPWR